MPWPLSEDYNEAVQSPESSFADPELRGSEVATNALGLPMPCSGNFADVYRFNCPASKRSWAVKCFTRQIPGLQERYQQISLHLQQSKPSFMVDFTFLERGIQVRGDWYPILKMQWVEGLPLNQFVKNHLDKPQILDVLSQLWVKLAVRLREANIAHCDLQHGNVLLVPAIKGGSLHVRLVDYDGMCVPALTLLKSIEMGHPSFQHPQRLREGIYSLEVDRFSHLVIYTALRSLMVGGQGLWERYDNGDNLLFCQDDFQAPAKSRLFYDLLKFDDSQVRSLAEHLIETARKPLDQALLLDQLVAMAQPGAPVVRRTEVRLQPAAVNSGQPVPSGPLATAGTKKGVGQNTPGLSPFDLNAMTAHGGGIAQANRRTGVHRTASSSKKRAVAIVVCAAGLLLTGLVGLWAGGVFRAQTSDGTARLEKTSGRLAKAPQPDRGGGKPSQVQPPPAPDPVVKRQPPPVPEPVINPQPLPVPDPVIKPQPQPSGFVPLFNGYDLNAWNGTNNAPPADPQKWRIENGILLCTSAPFDFLRTKKSYTNFHLRLETTINETGEGSIILHNAVRPVAEGGLRWQGYAVRVTGTASAAMKTGSLAVFRNTWNDEPLAVVKEIPGKAGEWFTLEVIAEQSHIITVVNGKKVVDWHDPAFTFTEGLISLRSTTPGTELRFRKIEVKVLSPALAGLPKAHGGAKGLDNKLPPQNLVLHGHAEKVMHLVFTPDGSCLVSASNGNHLQGRNMLPGIDNSVRIWSVESGKAIRVLRVKGFNYGPYGIGVSPDGQLVAACTSWETKHVQVKPMVFVWDIATGTQKYHFALPLDTPPMRAVSFSNDGKTLYALQGSRGTIHSWSVADGLKANAFELGHRIPKSGLRPGTLSTFACEYVIGPGLMAEKDPGAVHLWDRGSGKAVKSFAGHKKMPTCCTMSLDGTRVLSCAPDFSVRLWDVDSGRQVLCLANLDVNVRYVAISPDGKQFLTGGEDNIVRLWSISTGKQLARFEGHTETINCVAFSPDGTLAASGSDDKTIRLWPLNAKPGKEPKAEASSEPPVGKLPPAQPDAFVPLFNGKDLTGWKTHPSQPGNWRVVNGILTGIPSGRASHLYTERGDFENFHLRAVARVNHGGLGALFFRCEFGPEVHNGHPTWASGYSTRISSTPAHFYYTGSLECTPRPGFFSDAAKVLIKAQLHKPDEWFRLEVIANGNHIITKVNGQEAVNYTDEKRNHTQGHCALQTWLAATRVEFRTIEIKELR